MTYIVNDACIRCKYTDCVEVCPVDCFYEGENMLVIHPDECIDCGVCEPECPVEAIKPDTDPGMEEWVDFNRRYSESWPNITYRKDAPADAEAWEGRRQAGSAFQPQARRLKTLGRAPAPGRTFVFATTIRPPTAAARVRRKAWYPFLEGRSIGSPPRHIDNKLQWTGGARPADRVSGGS